jgi:hypothetical protein
MASVPNYRSELQSRRTGARFRKFVHHRSILLDEFRKAKGTSNLVIAGPLSI